MPKDPGLTLHRFLLAAALLCAGPALILHAGWAGTVPAVLAIGYAGHLATGKRWRRVRRSRRRERAPDLAQGHRHQ